MKKRVRGSGSARSDNLFFCTFGLSSHTIVNIFQASHFSCSCSFVELKNYWFVHLKLFMQIIFFPGVLFIHSTIVGYIFALARCVLCELHAIRYCCWRFFCCYFEMEMESWLFKSALDCMRKFWKSIVGLKFCLKVVRFRNYCNSCPFFAFLSFQF